MEALLTVLIPILLSIEGSNREIVPDGDGGDAVGCLQIHKIYVREVNRILGENKYTYNDRRNREKSIEMARIHITYWTPKNMDGNFLKKLIILGRIHNGGANGDKKPETLPYGEKIRKIYKKKKGDFLWHI